MIEDMSDADRLRWDQRYGDRPPLSAQDIALPTAFERFAGEFPVAGHALDLACGRGAVAVWLARRGMEVRGYDISAAAVTQARELAADAGVASRCEFEIADLDEGLPTGPAADVVICNKFRDSRLDRAIVGRLAVGGLLAVSALSEVGASPGTFRVRAGELREAFAALDVIAAEEAHGESWLLARRASG